MYIPMSSTLKQIARCCPSDGPVDTARLHTMYELTCKLQSQLLGVIYDLEVFAPNASAPRLASNHSRGENIGGTVTLTIDEALPSMKRLTEAVEEHWKAMIHAAIDEAAEAGPLPYYDKAMVAIEIITPRGTNNANIWDTSNRAINVVINNLKGIFFRDDNMEHMAFSVTGRWGERGITVLRITEFTPPAREHRLPAIGQEYIETRKTEGGDRHKSFQSFTSR